VVIGPNPIQGTGNRCEHPGKATGAITCVVLTLVVQSTTWGLTAVVPQVVIDPSRAQRVARCLGEACPCQKGQGRADSGLNNPEYLTVTCKLIKEMGQGLLTP
jgi:hypothetical protein